MMRRTFFNEAQGRTSFFARLGEGMQSIRLCLLLIQATSKKRSHFHKQRDVRDSVKKECDTIYIELNKLLQNHMLYKLAYHASEQRIAHLRGQLEGSERRASTADPELYESDEDIAVPGADAGSGAVIPALEVAASVHEIQPEAIFARMGQAAGSAFIPDFTASEQVSAETFVSTYFDRFWAEGVDCTPETIYHAMQVNFNGHGAKKIRGGTHSAFFSVLFDGIFKKLGLFELKQHFNPDKYGKERLGLSTLPEDQDTVDMLIDCMCLLFETMLCTMEHSEHLEELSSAVAKKGGDSSGSKDETIEGQFGQFSKMIPILIQAVLQNSDDADLRGEIATLLVPISEKSHEAQLFKRRTAKTAALVFNERMRDALLDLAKTDPDGIKRALAEARLALDAEREKNKRFSEERAALKSQAQRAGADVSARLQALQKEHRSIKQTLNATAISSTGKRKVNPYAATLMGVGGVVTCSPLFALVPDIMAAATNHPVLAAVGIAAIVLMGAAVLGIGIRMWTVSQKGVSMLGGAHHPVKGHHVVPVPEV